MVGDRVVHTLHDLTLFLDWYLLSLPVFKSLPSLGNRRSSTVKLTQIRDIRHKHRRADEIYTALGLTASPIFKIFPLGQSVAREALSGTIR